MSKRFLLQPGYKTPVRKLRCYSLIFACKVSLLISFLAVLSPGASAQCDSLFFRYTGTLITSLSLIDSNTILAAGDNGYIIKSVDGGKQWRNLPTYTHGVLYSLKMPTTSTGYALGRGQLIIKTEDQGETWFPLDAGLRQKPYYSPELLDACFLDKDRGFIVGDQGLILSTKDGGRSWKDTAVNYSERLTSVAFVNDSTGFICGSYQTLFKTSNRGKSWQKISLGPGNPFLAFKKITFFDNTNGFILGTEGACYRTTDAGETWTAVTLPGGYVYNDVCFITPAKGYIVAPNGNASVLVTTDGGVTWNFSVGGDYGRAQYCVGTDPAHKRLMIAGGGEYGGFYGYNGRNIVSSTDGGTTFNVNCRLSNISYRDLCFLNDSTGFIGGENGTTLKTTDYGESWQAVGTVPVIVNGNGVNRLFFTDALHGYAGSDNIFKTSDGGQSWTQTASPGGNPQFFARQMYFFDEQAGLVMNDGFVYKTTNSGSGWQQVVSPPQQNFLMDLGASANGRALVVGYDGYARLSTDRGSTWNPLNLVTGKFLTSAYFYDDNLAFIGTADTTLFKTTDGGNNWQQINTGIPQQMIKALHFLDPLTGYMICNNNGGSSSIYKTSDGGLTWRFQQGESENLLRISGFSNLYTVGGRGLVVKSDKIKRPVLPGYINGPDSVCANRSILYTTGQMAGVSYNWAYSGTGVSNAYLNNDTVVNTSPGTYTLSLSVSNACGTSATRTFSSTAVEFAPVITATDSVLTASEGISYQWMRYGGYIPADQGGTNRRFVPTLSGSYSVLVQSTYGCSETSPAIPFSLDRQRLLCPGDNAFLYSSAFGNSYQWQRNNGLGFVNLADDSTYKGSNTSSLLIRNIPASWYGYTYRCVTNFSTSLSYTLKFANKWTGMQNNTWENPGNWSCGQLPDANTDVIINSGNIVIHSDVTIRSLQINPSAQLTVASGYHLTITN